MIRTSATDLADLIDERFPARAYLSIAGPNAAGKFRVVKVSADASDDMTGSITRYGIAVLVAQDTSRILGVPLVLPTRCPVCGDTAEYCDALAGRES